MNETGVGRDAAEFTEASYTDDPADRLDSFRLGAHTILRASQDMSTVLDALCSLHAEFAPADCGCWDAWMAAIARRLANLDQDEKVRRVAFLFAVGLPSLDGHTMTEAARMLGVSRAAISKEACRWRDDIGLPANQYTKSERARRAYKMAHAPTPQQEVS